MTKKNAVEVQRKFYDSRPHDHLQPQGVDFYSARLVSELARTLGITKRSRVLEVGAGFGRFTFELLQHCESVVALDLSEGALSRLVSARDERSIPEARCQTLCADLQELECQKLGEPFDFVVGFFILHHLPDFPGAITRLAPCLRPGGGMAFLEPNRRNPLFAAQVAFCQDMPWSEEKGMFKLSSRAVERAYRLAGLSLSQTRRFGFFPPQIINRFRGARQIELGIERVGIFEPLLPFLLLCARASAEAPEASS